MRDLDLFGADATPDEGDQIETRAKVVGAKVSPWLWILSILGFAFAMQNRYQIQKMYGNWKSMKRALNR